MLTRETRVLWLLFVLLGLVLALSSCESGGSDAPDGDMPDGDQTDGDEPDGEEPDGDAPDGDEPDGDEPDGDVPDGDIPDGDNTDGDVDGDGEEEEPADDESTQGDATRFYMGYAFADVTPPDGTPMGGFGMPGGIRVTTGVHDPLLAQVAVFSNDTGRAFIIISQDTTGYSFDFGDEGPGVAELRRSISKAVKETLNVRPEHIMLGGSHSHAATDLVGFWQKFGKGIPIDLLNWHVEEITAAAQEAVASMKPVTLTYAETELVGLTGRDHEGLTVIDNTVSVLQVLDENDDIALTITLYAKHPTMMGDGNRLASADFIWGYREEMTAATGAPAMYLQGYEAALHGGPVSAGGEGFDRAYNVGKMLADAVLAIDTFTPTTEFDIRHRYTTFSAPLREGMVNDAFTLFDMPKRYYHFDENDVAWMEYIPISWHKLGSAEFVAMPGEATPEAAVRVRGLVSTDFAFPVGLADDCLGYIIDEELHDNEGLQGYELKMGLGRDIGIIAWQEHEALGWYNGAWRE